MRLWILKPRELNKNDNPWEPWYDKAFGFVVRAATEEKARRMAHKEAGDENRAWIDAAYSTCDPLDHKGVPGVVLRDFRRG